MAGYMTYWPGEQIRALKKVGDTGPIKVVYGSIHSRMPSIDSVKVGDILYPVTVIKGTLCVIARLPVENKEPAFDYLVRETGWRYAALIPDGVACYEKGYGNTFEYVFNDLNSNMPEIQDIAPTGYRIVTTTDEPLPHLLHQEPFNCCSQTAVSGAHGSSIEPRPIPKELLPDLRFGYPKSREKALRFNAKGDVLTMCVATTRRLSNETWDVFESLFE